MLLFMHGFILLYVCVFLIVTFKQTTPFLWYFYSAIPRGVAFSIFLIPFGVIYDVRVSRLLIPTFMFVLIYSILPHKELRFIIYVFPVLNVSAATFCNRVYA